MGTVEQSKSRLRASVIVAAVFLAYILVVVAYAIGDSPADPDTHVADPAGALVYLDMNSVDGEDFSLGVRVSVYPGRDLLDDNGYPRDGLVVDVSPIADDRVLLFEAGRSIGPVASTIYSDGDIRQWPFDRYRADSVVVRVFADTSEREPIPSTVVVTDSLTGWNVDAGPVDHASGEQFDITVSRNVASKVFALAICMVLLALPACALFVAVQTLRSRKKFQPPMVTWFAVMLFAVLPIRNLFPGAPPTGSWVDFSVVLWVVLGLVVAMIAYVYAWWREAP